MGHPSKPTGVLVYDICSTPDGIDLEKILHIWKNHEFILYDSTKGTPPSIINPENSKAVLVDVSNTSEEKLSEIQKLINDE